MSVVSSLCFPASAEEAQDLCAGKYQPASTNPKITAEKQETRFYPGKSFQESLLFFAVGFYKLSAVADTSARLCLLSVRDTQMLGSGGVWCPFMSECRTCR